MKDEMPHGVREDGADAPEDFTLSTAGSRTPVAPEDFTVKAFGAVLSFPPNVSWASAEDQTKQTQKERSNRR